MAEGERPVYCGQCGNAVEPDDSFCGNCGAAVPEPPPRVEQVIPRQVAAAQGAGYVSRRRRRRWVNAAMVSFVVLLGIGTAAALVLNGGSGLLGASDQRPTEDGEAIPPQSEIEREPTSPATSAPPSSEKQALEDFGREYDEAHRSGDWNATYSMLLESTQQNLTEEEWAEKQQVLRETEGTPPPLESVNVVGAGAIHLLATVTLDYEDGTEEDMSVTPGDSGEPKRVMSEQEIAELEGLPPAATEPTTVSPEPIAPEPTTFGSASPANLEAEAEEAAGEYYRAAGLEDWSYTYENLDQETRSGFTEEEWFEKNQWLADNGEVIYDIVSASMVDGAQERLASVTLTLTYEDGSSSARETFFVYEYGEWRHKFGQEETDLFMPDATFEEFVEAQG